VITGTFANGDTLGARIQGTTLTVYRNGASLGVVTLPSASSGGRIGVWFEGTTNTGAGNARIDNFGGGTLP
jgi:hypothetical protein